MEFCWFSHFPLQTAFPFSPSFFRKERGFWPLPFLQSDTSPTPPFLSLFPYRLLPEPCLFLIRLGKVPQLELKRDLGEQLCVNVSREKTQCLSQWRESLESGTWLMGEESRRSWPGLSDQKTCQTSPVCVRRLQREAGFVSFLAFSVLGSSIGVTPFLDFKAAQFQPSLMCQDLGVPRILKKGGKEQECFIQCLTLGGHDGRSDPFFSLPFEMMSFSIWFPKLLGFSDCPACVARRGNAALPASYTALYPWTVFPSCHILFEILNLQQGLQIYHV